MKDGEMCRELVKKGWILGCEMPSYRDLKDLERQRVQQDDRTTIQWLFGTS